MEDAQFAAAFELLEACGADRLEHPGGTLLAHLRRTARRLESWGADRTLTAAGLCHAAYGTRGFPRALLRLEQRPRLRQAIGEEAEAIVYAYCASDRAYERAAEGEVRDRFSGEYWTPAEVMRRALGELTAANELDVVEHAALSDESRAAIGGSLARLGRSTSPAAWSAVSAALHLARDAGPRGDAELSYRELGSDGPHVLLWHGGADPTHTWSRQHALSDAFALRIPWRRGYPPSVSAAPQDWGQDIRDLLRVMPGRAHVVAHSYGGVSALGAACIAPERFASLTIAEAPLWSLTPEEPGVQELVRLSRAFIAGAPEAREAFLALASLPIEHEETRRIERRARGLRDPADARFDLTALRAAALPVAIVSGGHNPAIEQLARAASRALPAQHWTIAGAGHAVPRLPELNARLRAFVSETDAAGG